MAGAIRTGAQNRAYDEGWERAFGRGKDERLMEEARQRAGLMSGKDEFAALARGVIDDVEAHAQWHKEHPDEEHVTAEDLAREWLEAHVECAYCHRTDLEAGQECACLSRPTVRTAAAQGCRRCGLPSQLGSDYCEGCDYERERPRRERALREAGLLRG